MSRCVNMVTDDTEFQMQGDRETFLPPVFALVAGGDPADSAPQTRTTRRRGGAGRSGHTAIESFGKAAWGAKGTTQHSHQRSVAALVPLGGGGGVQCREH